MFRNKWKKKKKKKKKKCLEARMEEKKKEKIFSESLEKGLERVSFPQKKICYMTFSYK